MVVRNYIRERYDDITKVPLDEEQNVYMLLDEHLWAFEKINQENKQKYLDIAEKLYGIWQEKVVSLCQVIKRNREAFENELNTSKNLYIYRRKYLLQEKQRLEVVEYPHEKIIRLEAQLEFVKNNAFFLSPQPRSKEVIHGLSRVSDPLGNGVTIGILDYFSKNLSSLPNELRPKVINPEFNGSENPDKEDALHGICVASIAASHEIGIARGAHLEYLDIQKFAFNNKQTNFLFGDAICQNQTRLEVHVSFLDSLPKFEKGKAYPIEKASIDLLNATFENNTQEIMQFENIGESPLLQTQAKVINMSLGNSTFEANFDLNTPDAYLGYFIHHKAFADLGILSVTTLGNNGLYLAGSNGLFVKRALAKAKATRNKILFVGGLLEDGLTILSYSNQPGDDLDLQERTIFTLGANVPCLFINTNTYGEESGNSFACPSVSGAAAIIMSQCPSLNAEEVSDCILKGATPILLDKEGLPYEIMDCDAGTILESHLELQTEVKRSRAKYGMGRLNVSRALERAKKMVR